MARLRYNNAAGTLGPALTATGTTIGFASAPAFATIAAPNYVPLALDPPQGPTPNPSFEIVYLTAYTAGATTGTISRGMEGTTGQPHNAGAVWAQAVTLLDIQSSPVGSIVPYAGTGDPPESNWIIADGRLINRTIYADFFARVGHAYNAGVDPGGGTVKIPDKRGKHSMGAYNMGSAAGAPTLDNQHNGQPVGFSSGEVNHTLSTTEGPVHNHWNNLSQTNLDHQHTMPLSASSSSVSTDSGHAHDVSFRYNLSTAPNGTAQNVWTYGLSIGTPETLGPVATTTNSASISTTTTTALTIGDGNNGLTRSVTGTYGGTTWNHGHTIPWDLGTTPSGGGSAGTTAAHNNLPPYECDSYIVRIA